MHLASRAAEVLVGNDTGTMVTAAPKLYPHMWSWDTAFITIGLAHLSVSRAARELETLLAAQWRDGMLPHIVFGRAGGYFPGPSRWSCAALSPLAPAEPATSGICAPPVHALALRRVVDIGLSRADPRIAGLLTRSWPRLYRWHAWLARYRDPDGSGLLSIVHGWESGTDNSPRWDIPYAAVHPDVSLPPYERLDRALVSSADERPSDADYDRYLWLIEELRAARYDPAEVVRTSSFLVGDVLFSALFALACDVLADLGALCSAPVSAVRELRGWAASSRCAVSASRGPDGLPRDLDRRTGTWLATRTIAGFAPLLCGGLSPAAEHALLGALFSPAWAGHPGLAAGVPPSVSPVDPSFHPRAYWRGPLWPVIVWLYSWALHHRGLPDPAAQLRAEGLRLTADGTFAEYYHPYTGEPLGSHHQSWTAAVVLDWLSSPG